MNLFIMTKKIEISDIIDFLRRALDNTLEYITVSKYIYSIAICYKENDNDKMIRIEIHHRKDSSYVHYFDKHICIDFDITTESQKLDLMFYANKILDRKMEESYNFIDTKFRTKNFDLI